jgi:hypothetical protein
VAVAATMLQTRLLSVMDREADFFELFDEQRRHPRVDLLVRAKYDRTLEGEPRKLFAAVRQAPVAARVQVEVPRQSARPKRAKQQARPQRLARTATLAVRSQAVRLRPPPYHKDKAPIALWVLHAVEEHPPPGAEPVEWFLLTTLPLASPEDALQCLRWYCLRWRIEDWHRVLKSGCRIEALAHETAERLQRAIAINLVIAWRIMLMTLLGRETPDLLGRCCSRTWSSASCGPTLKKTPAGPHAARRGRAARRPGGRLPGPGQGSAPGPPSDVAWLRHPPAPLRGVRAPGC